MKKNSLVFKNLFRNSQQMQLFFLLIASTLFCFSLVAFRLDHVGIDLQEINSLRELRKRMGMYSFLFLIWNLFLAWIPYLIALVIPIFHKKFNSKIILTGLLLSWLLFFPNAPYIITDLLHIKSRASIPLWYDVMMIVSFAWTGLILGFLSLYEVQFFLKKFFNPFLVKLATISAIFLCGFGIYIGRFQRWNTWDILTDPFSLMTDVLNTLIHPMAYIRTLGLAIVISVFLLLGYLTILTLLKGER